MAFKLDINGSLVLLIVASVAAKPEIVLFNSGVISLVSTAELLEEKSTLNVVGYGYTSAEDFIVSVLENAA